jgi:2-dehydro-3-deoxyphosphogluconate aldolase/(4S)-4-hydroxy-2-oxoglutarate aldolase
MARGENYLRYLGKKLPRLNRAPALFPCQEKKMPEAANLQQLNMLRILRDGPIIPVLVIEHVEQAVPLAEALVAGGVRVLEITLRTPVALQGLYRITREVPQAILGAGTVVQSHQIQSVADAGAQFVVSPGFTSALSRAAHDYRLPLLPGVATPSEIMLAMEHGHEALKFFPAEENGGVATLKALYGPFPNLRFCPTGGIRAHNLTDYLTLPNVVCVGSSYLTPASLMQASDWAGITRHTQQILAQLRL